MEDQNLDGKLQKIINYYVYYDTIIIVSQKKHS